MTINDLIQKIQEKKLKIDLDLIMLAYDFAEDAHRGQFRKSGEPYIEHALAATSTLIDLGLDQATLIACLLHDVPEDTAKTLKDIEENFGQETALLVAGITKLGQVKYRGLDKYAENLRRMFIAMAEDIRTIIIKFADRLHNLRSLGSLSPKKRLRIAKETLEIYGPIANRLSMGVLKNQLEDYAFAYAHPKEYQWIEDLIGKNLPALSECLENQIIIIEKLLKYHQIKVISCLGRAKGKYSLYRKLLLYNKDINQIYDLIALRIIVPTIEDCYAALGYIHSQYKPLKGRIKDYIAQPKPNGYKSLHTTVFCPDGNIFEIQIRTPEIHREAEYGIAAYWNYDEAGQSRALVHKLAWVKEMARWQEDMKDQKNYLEALKIDVFQNRIFIFTPKGDVIDLPENSTPIDFAYNIHSDIGNKAVGAKINNEIANLDTKLKSGDMVEIIVNKNRKQPNPDWIKIAKTRGARSKIRANLKQSSWVRFKFW